MIEAEAKVKAKAKANVEARAKVEVNAKVKPRSSQRLNKAHISKVGARTLASNHRP